MDILNRYLFLILFVSGSLNVLGQSSAGDTLKEDNKASLAFSVLYGSNAGYYGQTTTERLPYISASGRIQFPVGLFLSASAYKLFNVNERLSGLDVTGGYTFKFNKKTSGNFSYTRSFFPDSSLFLQSTNLHTFSGGLHRTWTWLNTGIYADYIPGDQGGLFLTLNAARSLDLGSLGTKDYFTFEPSFSLVSSTQRIFTTERVSSSSQAGNGKAPVRLPFTRNNQTPQYKTIEKTGFGILSYNLNLPFLYNRTNYSVELAYQGALLAHSIEQETQKPRSFFSLAFYYTL